MMTELKNASKAFLDFLHTADDAVKSDPAFTTQSALTRWLGAVYSADGFLYEDDYFDLFNRCREKPVSGLNLDETRGMLTFLIRQMRCSYVPYPCVLDGSLAALLEHWLELVKEEN